MSDGSPGPGSVFLNVLFSLLFSKAAEMTRFAWMVFLLMVQDQGSQKNHTCSLENLVTSTTGC